MKQLTNNSFSKQKGFTLIELVVVIVILGILAATAVPKFIDLTGDARTSVMKGVQGSISSAVNLAHAKALVEGQTGDPGQIIIGSKYYALVNGFPSIAGIGDDDGSEDNGYGVVKLIELEDGTDITFAAGVFTHSGATNTSTCTLTYANAADSETPPVIEVVLTGC